MKKAIGGAFVAALVIKIFILDLMIAEGHSMFPVIKPGSLLVVSRLSYGIKPPGADAYLIRWAVPREGDIVVFYTPLGEIAVKRCGASDTNDAFYALGDNSAHSYDSRNYGPVSNDNVIGRVLGRK